MFEGSVSSIPSILAYMNSWLNPHFFFLLLNLMIGTIVFTSTFNNRQQQIPTHPPPPPPPQITSTNNNIGSDEFHDPEEIDSVQDSNTHFPQTLTLDPTQQVASFEKEVDQTETETETETPTLDDVYVQTMVNKSISRTIPDIPVMSKGRMKKSVSMKADIIVTRFEAEAEEEEEERVEDRIESRRPATMRERKTTEKDEYGVDEKADDFINKFKQQLMLQRMDSIGRQREIRVKK